jgi:hypothetical protein
MKRNIDRVGRDPAEAKDTPRILPVTPAIQFVKLRMHIGEVDHVEGGVEEIGERTALAEP